jgi:hypothetical protein
MGAPLPVKLNVRAAATLVPVAEFESVISVPFAAIAVIVVFAGIPVPDTVIPTRRLPVGVGLGANNKLVTAAKPAVMPPVIVIAGEATVAIALPATSWSVAPLSTTGPTTSTPLLSFLSMLASIVL